MPNPTFTRPTSRPKGLSSPRPVFVGAAVALSLASIPAITTPAHALTDAEEIALGKRVAPNFEMRWGGVLPDDDPMARRVQRLGAPLARLSKRHLPFEYKVLDNDQILNAYTAPGGRICITRRLVNLAANDAELTSILAHETAHVDRRHIAQTYEKHQQAQKRAHRLSHMLLGNMVSTGEGSLVSVSTSVAFVLMEQGHSRESESEADAYGVRWMSRLGYDPRSFVSILQRMAPPEKKQEDKPPSFLQTHPELSQRCADVRALIAREHLLAVAEGHQGLRYWAPPEKTQRSKRRLRHHRRFRHTRQT